MKILSRVVSLIALLISSATCFSQDASRNNFFKDIYSLDVIVGIDGELKACRLTEQDVKSSVSYILSNTPLKKIDPLAADTLVFNIVVLNPKIDNSSVGCVASINTELLRLTNFKGKNNLVAVWTAMKVIVGPENNFGTRVRGVAEETTKDFISKWTAQR